MRMGAVDYIAKPFDHEDMINAVRRITADFRARQIARPTRKRKSNAPTIEGLIGSCALMTDLFNDLYKIAPTNSTVLIRGETGTGKELVAQAIHRYSTSADNALITVNCAAIPETLIESELFGYEKGAFTGASTSRMGLIEAADQGTLFLDEIGELPIEAQARLLRFIQEGEIRRIGSVESRKVNVRLICATHRDLQQLTQDGGFRQDLYYRINVLKLVLPPLRMRGKDILELAEYILAERCKTNERSPLQFSPKAIQAITTYSWPGNVRELENSIERAAVLCEGHEIDSDLLDIDLELVLIETAHGAQSNSSSLNSTRKGVSPDPSEDLSLEDYFQRFVLEHQDSMSETELAQKLGVSRKCLWERRQRFGIPRKKNTTKSKGATAESL
jgi:two-component system response regulator HydG